jgi:hypothetical protein
MKKNIASLKFSLILTLAASLSLAISTPALAKKKNQDGDSTCHEKKITSAEGTHQTGGNAVDNFARFDANHDDILSKREWPGDPGLFDRLDKNRDKKVTRAEYTQM